MYVNAYKLLRYQYYNYSTKQHAKINMTEVEDPAKITPHFTPINGREDLLHGMYSKNDTYLDAVDNVQYEATTNMYIKDKTIQKYQGANKCQLTWIFDKGSECVGGYESTDIRNTFDIQKGDSVWQNNKSVHSKSVNIIKGANDSSKPINFEDLSVEIFIKFLFVMTRKKIKEYN